MTELSYTHASVPVREDLLAAHRSAFQRLAQPGSFWTGQERLAIAAEARHAPCCPLCEERKAALSPDAVQGEHRSLGALAEVMVDVIHRVVTDPSRLSRAWLERTLARGLGDAAYVEILGVVTTIVAIDAFCRGIGVAPHPLPEPRPGEPSRRRPARAKLEGAWIPMIPQWHARGPEADLYDGAMPNVLRALSLVPDEVRTLKTQIAAHYLEARQVIDVRASRGALDRAQMELIAGRVSALNECFY